MVERGANDRDLAREMERARKIVEMGRKERDEKRIKVRQPLAGATGPGPQLSPQLEAVVLDELNLKSFTYGPADLRQVQLDTEVTPELRLEGLAREIVRRVQETRKEAGLNIEDRIHLWWRADGQLAEAFEAHGALIAQETLAREVHRAGGDPPDWVSGRDHRIDGEPLWVGLRGASGEADQGA